MNEVHGKPFGFTLLEVLVVLAIAGLLAAMTLPRLKGIAESVEINSQRTDLKLAIEGLGYQAYLSGKPMVLTIPVTGTAPGRAEPGATLAVPPGWRVQILQQVRYAVNGVCGGGKLMITDPEGHREAYLLKAPQCRLNPIEVPD